jgi:transcriptional regulatory protein RtcR
VREQFLTFARSPAAKWNANFRDLNACITRMATLAPGERITSEILDGELGRLRQGWSTPVDQSSEADLGSLLGSDALEALDLFDRAQLVFVIRICRECPTSSEAGRKLFGATREKRKVQNDADPLRKYLARFNLDWQTCRK